MVKSLAEQSKEYFALKDKARVLDIDSNKERQFADCQKLFAFSESAILKTL